MYPLTPQTRQKALRVFNDLPTDTLVNMASSLPKTNGGSKYALTELQRQIEKDLISQKKMFVDEDDIRYEQNKNSRTGFELNSSIQRAPKEAPWNPRIEAPGSLPRAPRTAQEPRLSLRSSATAEMTHQKPVIDKQAQSREIVRQTLRTNPNQEYDNSEIYSDNGGGSGLPF